jgi:hypothetical protein
MNTSSKLLSIVIIGGALTLGGCGSTERRASSPVMLNTIKPVPVYSTDEYNWKDNGSLALNIAEMVKPAGAGFGLRDKADPTNGVQSSGGGSGLFNFATGFYTGDILSGLGQVVLGSKQDKLLDYNPYIIDFVPIDEMDINESVATTNFLMERLGRKMEASIKSSGIDVRYKGVYSYIVERSKRNTGVYLDGAFCREGADFLAPKNIKGAEFKPSISRTSFLDIDPAILNSPTSCNVLYETSIVGQINGHYIISHEMYATNLSIFLHTKVAPHSDMAFFFPETYNHINEATFDKYVFSFPYAFVSYKGQQYMFDSKEDSKPLFE